MCMLTVVVPAYNEEKNIDALSRILGDCMRADGTCFELLFVDDGSRDGTWNEVEAAARQYPFVSGIRFSRNFGKEAAIAAGLAYAKGNGCCIIMDCDLQHPPQTAVQMLKLWREQKVDIVEARKHERGRESIPHRFCAGIFNRIFERATGIDMANASDFRLLDRRVVDILNSMPEKNTFFRALSGWTGFKTAQVYFDVPKRQNGLSKWSRVKLMRYAANAVIAFSASPLHIVSVFGLVFLGLFLLLSVLQLCGVPIGMGGAAAWLDILLFFMGGLILTGLGIIGCYLSRVYDEIRGRPRYIVTAAVHGSSTEDGKKE